MTTAAVTLFMLAAMPFIAAIFGYLFLGELLRRPTLIAMVIAFIGICLMIINDSIAGSVLGALIGFISACGFAFYTVTIRWRPETPKFTTVAFAGIFCATTAAIVLFNSNSGFISSSHNEGLFAIHGTLVCLGLILYSLGSKAIPAAELTLLSLTEVIGGIFWVWLPWLGINEIPSTNTIIGGFFIFMAIFYYSLLIKSNRRFIGLN